MAKKKTVKKTDDIIENLYHSDDGIRYSLKERDPSKRNIYMILTGGTIIQKRNEKGNLEPYPEGNKDLIRFAYDRNLGGNVNIDFADFGNIDSTEMITSHRKWDEKWQNNPKRPRTRTEIAEEIFRKIYDYDGFVVTHGTDTMTYSAAALSLMLRDLGKPVVLTGSQKSAFENPSDGPSNIGWALRASTEDLAGVYIAFGDRILIGSRGVKVDENGSNAFDTPRVPPVGQIGANLKLYGHRNKRNSNADTSLFTRFDSQVVYYQLTSGCDDRVFSMMVDSDEVDGIVIGAFGAGNVQSYLYPHIKRATEKGKPIIINTNCLLGATESLYESGSGAIEAGAISGLDMTTEMSWTKLMYAIGRWEEEIGKYPNLKLDRKMDFIRRIMHTSYADELTPVEESEWESKA